MNIFIGLTDIANVTANYAKGFRALGHSVFSAVWSKSLFYPDAQYSLVIDKREIWAARNSAPTNYLSMAAQLVRLVAAWKCDLFIFYAPAVLPNHLYYPILKAAGKKIVTVFWGSDVRYWYTFAEEMRKLGAYHEMAPFFDYARTRSGGSYWDKLRTVKTAERYSDLILAQPDSGQLLTRPYMRTHVPLDLSEYRFNVPGRTEPLIVHAPSVPEAKGTDVILRVIQELRAEGIRFEFRRIENMPNSELRRLLAESDIVVDEIYAATVGGLSAEAMATGNTVLVRYMEEYSKVPPGCPALNTSIFTLKENLRQMIVNVSERKARAAQGRSYVEAVNDHIKVCKDILDWLKLKDSLAYDFHPTAFKSITVPLEILEAEKAESKQRRAEFFKTLLATGGTKRKSRKESA